MTGAAIDDVVLDHVAHAVPRWQDVWERYAVDLGASWSSGGLATGFAPGQVEFANQARLELLMPNDTGSNDFLARFLARNGPGPHHLTFKVPDLEAAIEQSRRAGYEPIGIDLSDQEWMEAFIHPKQATGVVVQMAQAPNPWTGPPPDDFPTARRQHRDGSGPTRPAALRWVTHAVAELEVATPLFVQLLGAEVTGEGSLPDQRWMELTWGGPMGLRLAAPVGPSATPLRQWLGSRSGRVHHLDLDVEEPGGITGARPGNRAPLGSEGGADSGPFWVVPAEENAGMGLVLRAG
jgi:Glyoxalase-like domain